VERAERVQAILQMASEVAASEVATLLDRECAGDEELRSEVESLLRSLNKVGRFLLSPTSGEEAFGEDAARIGEGPGTRIGAYRLLELIGEGGFGSVFMAEQEQPVRRKVAIKIIKLGMDTRQVVTRFEQERQALALMDHSHIAKVLDAGATESGRPYFVMELVNGEPIVEWCDKNSLSIRDRLELFAQVCGAVQHAHTKGVIHRDIKPSNVLVRTQDGRPHAKVIDFGIAKATSARLTEKTFFTEHRQLVGTPQYMSPEQAERSPDIDTRTDVYSLGVLLYELLTGTTPFKASELRAAAYGEMERIIREVEPPRPSTRLSRSSDTIASVAASRRTQPEKLGALVRGELDWVVMKALEKDRGRRYESPSTLESDIRRYLNNEAVMAAPTGNTYRLRKLMRRHAVLVSAGLAVFCSLLIGVVAFAWQSRVATQQRDAAEIARTEAKQRADETQLVSEFQGRMLSQIDATAAGEQLWADLQKRLDASLEKSGVQAPERQSRTRALMHELAEINATDTAAAMIDRTILKPSIKEIGERFKDQPAAGATLRYSVAQVYHTLGLDAESLPLVTASAETFERLHGPDYAGALDARSLQGELLFGMGRAEEAVRTARATLDGYRRMYGADHASTLGSMSNLGNMLRAQRNFGEAEPLLKGALEGSRRTLGESHKTTLIALNTYGHVLIEQGQRRQAEPYWREAYERGLRVYGPDDPDVLIWAANMGGLLSDLGKYADAAARYRDAVEGFRRMRGEEHPYTLLCQRALSDVLALWGGGADARAQEATSILSDVLRVQLRTLGEEHPDTLGTQTKVGMRLHDLGKLGEAEAMLRGALDVSRRVYGGENATTLGLLSALAMTLSDATKYAESNLLYSELLDSAARALGKDHDIYLISAKLYAESLCDQGGTERHAEAEATLRELVEIRERVSGTAHPATIRVHAALGNVLAERGRLDEAEPIIARVLDAFRGIEPCDHIDTALAISSLGDLRIKQGRAREAEPMLLEALEMRRRLFQQDHPSIPDAQAALARCRALLKQ
jgi:serine/threonine protein kinase/tetratricopeptide (TPR) repeat protein